MADASQEPIVNEALQLVTKANERGLILRLMGAIAFRVHCTKYQSLFSELKRVLSDIDLAAYSSQRGDILKYMCEFGYEVDIRHAFVRGDRLILNKREAGYHVDIFFDKLEMCHTIDFKGILTVDYPTIPLSALLLEKLQIVHLTEKDVKDVAVLLLEHEVGESDDETINLAHIAKILSDDWGFYYTATTNLKKTKELLAEFLPQRERLIVSNRIDVLLKRIDEEPKAFKWKVRSCIGTRKKWYQDVEEEHKIIESKDT